MSKKTTILITSLFTYLLAGYLAGLVIGFTLFDPDWDVWALLAAVLAIAGLFLGLLPAFRRAVPVVLTAMIGFYAGTLLGSLLFGGNDLLDALEKPGSVILILVGTAVGVVVGVRNPVERFRFPLFAFVFGGFATPLILIALFPLPRSDISLAPLVVISGLLWGGLALVPGRQTKRGQQSALPPTEQKPDQS